MMYGIWCTVLCMTILLPKTISAQRLGEPCDPQKTQLNYPGAKRSEFIYCDSAEMVFTANQCPSSTMFDFLTQKCIAPIVEDYSPHSEKTNEFYVVSSANATSTKSDHQYPESFDVRSTLASYVNDVDGTTTPLTAGFDHRQNDTTLAEDGPNSEEAAIDANGENTDSGLSHPMDGSDDRLLLDRETTRNVWWPLPRSRSLKPFNNKSLASRSRASNSSRKVHKTHQRAEPDPSDFDEEKFYENSLTIVMPDEVEYVPVNATSGSVDGYVDRERIISSIGRVKGIPSIDELPLVPGTEHHMPARWAGEQVPRKSGERKKFSTFEGGKVSPSGGGGKTTSKNANEWVGKARTKRPQTQKAHGDLGAAVCPTGTTPFKTNAFVDGVLRCNLSDADDFSCPPGFHCAGNRLQNSKSNAIGTCCGKTDVCGDRNSAALINPDTRRPLQCNAALGCPEAFFCYASTRTCCGLDPMAGFCEQSMALTDQNGVTRKCTEQGSCPGGYDCVSRFNSTLCCPNRDNVCTQRMNRGRECVASPPQNVFYYDRERGDCRPFVYSGCSGNSNRFETEEECNQYCGELNSAPYYLDRRAGGSSKVAENWKHQEKDVEGEEEEQEEQEQRYEKSYENVCPAKLRMIGQRPIYCRRTNFGRNLSSATRCPAYSRCEHSKRLNAFVCCTSAADERIPYVSEAANE